MTYNVFGGTLSLTQSINQPCCWLQFVRNAKLKVDKQLIVFICLQFAICPFVFEKVHAKDQWVISVPHVRAELYPTECSSVIEVKVKD